MFKMTFLRFFIPLLLIYFVTSSEISSLTDAKDFKNNTGVQIYLVNTNTAFSFLSIDATVTNKLKATFYLYTTIDPSTLSTGLYTSIGFGTSKMEGADIMLCGYEKSGSYWCKDYKGTKDNITPATQITTVTKFSWTEAPTSFSPYKFVGIWNVERTMDPAPTINGKIPAIYAFGPLASPGFPSIHYGGFYSNVNTGDGNSGSSFVETASATTGTTGSTTTGTTGSTTTGTTASATTGTTGSTTTGTTASATTGTTASATTGTTASATTTKANKSEVLFFSLFVLLFCLLLF